MVALGGQLGLPVPRRVKIFAIEVQDPCTVGDCMTPPLRRAVGAIATRVLAAARRLSGRRTGPRREREVTRNKFAGNKGRGHQPPK
jgi:hypothetical protein